VLKKEKRGTGESDLTQAHGIHGRPSQEQAGKAAQNIEHRAQGNRSRQGKAAQREERLGRHIRSRHRRQT